MTDAGWHPDPHGRADRRYHDGTRWTEHVTDAEGRTTSIDRIDDEPAAEPTDGPGSSAPASLDIGPPPPRAVVGAPPSGSPSAPATPVRGTPAPIAPPTERLSPEDVAAATAGPPSRSTPPSPAPPVASVPSPSLGPPSGPMGADHTIRMSPEEVAAAAALARSEPPAPGAASVHNTQPIGPEEIAAAGALASPADGPAPGAARRERLSVLGLGAALLGLAVGLAALLVLTWGSIGDVSYLDLREAFDEVGPDVGAVTLAFVLTGAAFAVVVGGLAALARAVGRRPLRVAAAVVVVLGAAGFAVLGFLAIDVVGVASGEAQATDVGPEAGATVTLPDGSPVTEPTTGAEVTVPEEGAGAAALTDEQLAGASQARAEDRLTSAATVGAAILVVAALLLVAGLLLPGLAGHAATAVGLVVVAGWAAAAVLSLGDEAGVGDLGIGAYAIVASAVLLAVGAALPPRRRAGPAPDPAG